MPVLKMTKASLTRTEIARIEINAQMRVAGNFHIGDGGDVFQPPPGRARFHDHAPKLREHRRAVTRRRAAPYPGKIRTRRAGDHAIEAPGRRVELAHVAAIDQIGTTDNAEALSLKAAAEQIDARKKREH
jgi:hypothetical protein